MIREAAATLRGVARKTPVLPFGRQGSPLFIKAENLQATGSFKIRGAFNKLSSLTREEAARGVIACSAGNHAQGVAFSAMHLGMRAVICMPAYAPVMKVEGTRSYGAEVVLVSGNYDDSAREAERLAEEKGYTFAHSFNDARDRVRSALRSSNRCRMFSRLWSRWAVADLSAASQSRSNPSGRMSV